MPQVSMVSAEIRVVSEPTAIREIILSIEIFAASACDEQYCNKKTKYKYLVFYRCYIQLF